MSATDEIQQFLLKKLDETPAGIRYAGLAKSIRLEFPAMKHGTVAGGIRRSYQKNTKLIYKPEKGLFRLLKYQDALANSDSVATPVATESESSVSESDFYESFADWLTNDLEECTKAKELGGNVFGGKWGTPDVVGVSKAMPTDIIKNETEIISAEIKLATSELITAFGQACSYKLFSHKVYLVIPEQSNPDEKSRLDSLCYLFGIGLVLYDSSNSDMPNYELKNRAQKGSPDTFYINKNISKAIDFFNDLLS
jgi:hypothetical protein